jgi:hypothetical protein
MFDTVNFNYAESVAMYRRIALSCKALGRAYARALRAGDKARAYEIFVVQYGGIRAWALKTHNCEVFPFFRAGMESIR